MHSQNDNNRQQNRGYIFGIHPVRELIETHPERLDRVWFELDANSGQLFSLLKLCRKLRIAYQSVPAQKLSAVASTSKHQGVVAFCSAVPYADVHEILTSLGESGKTPIFLLPASVEDPGNLGAIIRTSVAFSVDAILLERKNTVPLNATVAKASTGMIEHVSIAKPRNLEQVIKDLKDSGIQLIGAQKGDYKSPDQIDFTKPTILAVGGENKGIPPYIAKQCTEFVNIPSNSIVQSLNVSVATAILLYECSRQRGFPVS